MQPSSQQAPAHRRHRAVEHAAQRVLVAAGHVRVELEVAARGRIQRERVLRVLHAQPREVRQLAALRILEVLQQRARGGDGRRHAAAAVAVEVARAEERAQ